jgi:hypothetical protein
MGWGEGWLPLDVNMTIAAAMRATGFTRRRIQILIHSGSLGHIEFAGRVLIPRADVAAVVQRIGNSNGKRPPPAASPRRRRGPVGIRMGRHRS